NRLAGSNPAPSAKGQAGRFKLRVGAIVRPALSLSVGGRSLQPTAIDLLGSSSCGFPADRLRHIECRDRPAETLPLQVSEVFELPDPFDRASDAAADQDLPILGRGTEPGGEVAYGADRGVAGAFRKADLPEGCVALRNADAEAEFGGMTAAPCSY